MSLTITSLTHPTMIAKIRKGIYYAHKGQGHKMNGHGQRCYIQNRLGHNIMRINWVGGRQGYIVWGSESKDITKTVKMALHSVKVRDMALSYGSTPSLSAKLGRIAGLAGTSLALTACQSSGVVTAVFSLVGGVIV